MDGINVTCIFSLDRGLNDVDCFRCRFKLLSAINDHSVRTASQPAKAESAGLIRHGELLNVDAAQSELDSSIQTTPVCKKKISLNGVLAAGASVTRVSVNATNLCERHAHVDRNRQHCPNAKEACAPADRRA